MRFPQLAPLALLVCCIFPVGPVQAINLYGAVQAQQGFTQENEDEWNKGLRSFSDGDFAAAFGHWRTAGTPYQNDARGYYLAQIGLSILLGNGLGVQKDDSEADRWMALAHEDRNSTFQEKIGNSYVGAIYATLGRLYEEGRGVAKDFDKARNAYFVAAGYENAEAKFRIGAMLESGKGAPSWDYAGAAAYYTQAAKSGLAKAQFALATMYFDGRGYPQDFKRAYLWYSLAVANQGKADDFDAISRRDNLAAKMSPEELASAQEMARQCMTSEYAECD